MRKRPTAHYGGQLINEDRTHTDHTPHSKISTHSLPVLFPSNLKRYGQD